MLTWKSRLLSWRNAGVEDRTNKQTLLYNAVAIYKMLKLRPCSLQSSSKNVSNFNERVTKCLQKSQAPKSTGELDLEVPCVWKSHVSTVSMDLTSMLTK